MGSIDRHLGLTSRALPVIFFDGSTLWITGTFAAGTIVFAVGIFSLVGGSVHQRLLQGWSRYVSFISALVFVSAPMTSSGWVLYGVAAAAFGIFVPFALTVSEN